MERRRRAAHGRFDIKSHPVCIAEHGKKLRDCHFDQVKDLREKISRKDAERSFAILKAAGASAIEMSEAKPAASIPES